MATIATPYTCRHALSDRTMELESDSIADWLRHLSPQLLYPVSGTFFFLALDLFQQYWQLRLIKSLSLQVRLKDLELFTHDAGARESGPFLSCIPGIHGARLGGVLGSSRSAGLPSCTGDGLPDRIYSTCRAAYSLWQCPNLRHLKHATGVRCSLNSDTTTAPPPNNTLSDPRSFSTSFNHHRRVLAAGPWSSELSHCAHLNREALHT
ncbi:hypothetical protein K469DRAFT_217886 [Zopfia rhizophila CBS 207.26]|uniref:Uncharacterized protein n=1 Tax=Zopfia rhizophila CBS 207.26 TaxID=1314779 RepID=A0A6A6DTR5_9PEZI|nr:hypothetical protein K469DRAFT_217886 [Zopfia rhizophila CBS 207.26]